MIFLLQIIFSVSGAVISAYWTLDNMSNSYLDYNAGGIRNYGNQDLGYIIATMTGSWILIFW